MTEAEFQAEVVNLAKLSGWDVHHVSPHMVRPGIFRSDTPGWPDLTLVRDGVIIFAELKSDVGRVDDKQKYWLNRLTRATETYVWRPSNLAAIAHRLRSTENTPFMEAMRWG